MHQHSSHASGAASSRSGQSLIVFAWLSIAAAIVTIVLKVIAWRVTGSVGMLSDAAESLVNLVAAILALAMLTVAAKPADQDHLYGHAKAEYFSAAFEGIMIFVASVAIIVAAVSRLLDPQPLTNPDSGVIVGAVAAAINGAVGVVLIRAGRKHNSITLVADGKHLWTDVVTTVGVIVALIVVKLTGWVILDPIIALAVGINIIVTGTKLIASAVRGLMDETLPPEENRAIAQLLADNATDDVIFHGLRTRQAGRMRFVSFDMLVPGDWSVQRGHDLVEEIEQKLAALWPETHIAVHLEPREDPRSYDDHEAELPIELSDGDNP
jgi:cation diffusion facilitator family transporter